MRDSTQRIPEQYCPYCKRLLDTTTELMDSEVKPKAGDFSICCFCAEILVFDEDLCLREPSMEQLKMLEEVQPIIDAMRRAALQVFKDLDAPTQK